MARAKKLARDGRLVLETAEGAKRVALLPGALHDIGRGSRVGEQLGVPDSMSRLMLRLLGAEADNGWQWYVMNISQPVPGRPITHAACGGATAGPGGHLPVPHPPPVAIEVVRGSAKWRLTAVTVPPPPRQALAGEQTADAEPAAAPYALTPGQARVVLAKFREHLRERTGAVPNKEAMHELGLRDEGHFTQMLKAVKGLVDAQQDALGNARLKDAKDSALADALTSHGVLRLHGKKVEICVTDGGRRTWWQQGWDRVGQEQA